MCQAKNTIFALSTFGPGEKMQYLQKITIRIYTSKSIGFKGIFTASIVLLHNCFGPGEKYNICKISKSEFTHQNPLDLKAFYSFHCTFAELFWVRRKSVVFAPSTFVPGEKYNICTKYFRARRTNTIFAKFRNPNFHIEICWI